MSAEELRSLAEVDRVIHEPARLLIVTLLSAVKEADFLYLQRESGLTKGNLSSHLTKLEQAGYIDIQKTFRGKIPLTILSLTRTGRTALDGYKRKMKSFLVKG
jgi:DNA-binding transcriptional ArsR family regulator